MKKVSVYFTDRQSEALEAKAVQAGITFAEALRRALDEWLAQQEGHMNDLDHLAATGNLMNYRLRSGKLLRDATKPEIEAEANYYLAQAHQVFAQTKTKKPRHKKRS